MKKINIMVTMVMAFAAISNAADVSWNIGDTSGNWGTSVNWSGGVVPAKDVVTLGDVTTGKRVVTIDVTTTNDSLTMAQATVGATNVLSLSTLGIDLVLTNLTSLNFDETAGSIEINMTGGDLIAGDGTSANATVDFEGADLDISNDSMIYLSTAAGKTGTFRMGGDNVLTAPASIRMNDGSCNVYVDNGGSLAVTGDGEVTFGRINSTSSSRTINLYVNDGAALSVDTNTTLILKELRAYGQAVLYNYGVVNLGSATEPSTSEIVFDVTRGSTGAPAKTYNGSTDGTDTGIFNIYSAARIDLGNRSNTTDGSEVFNNPNSIMNFIVDSNGGGFYNTFSDYDIHLISFFNKSVINIQVHPSGTSGVALWANDGGRPSLKFYNNSGGSININNNATFKLLNNANKAGEETTFCTLYTDSGSTLNVGVDCKDTSSGGVLELRKTGNNSIPYVALINSGNLDILGNSKVYASMVQGEAGDINTWYFETFSGSDTELNNTSTIGTNSVATKFYNEGLFTKTGSGSSFVYSDGNGCATNAGTLKAEGGIVTFSEDLYTSNVVEIVIGGTETADYGTIGTEGKLIIDGGTLNVTLADGYAPGTISAKILDFDTISGTFDTVNLPDASWSSELLYTQGIVKRSTGTILIVR